MPLWSSRLLSNNSSNTSSSNGPSTTRSPPDASTPRSRPDGPASLSYLGANTVPQSATQSRPPARSFGNTIPAMLGGTKKKITTNNDCDTKQAPASSVGPRRYDENELDIVVCATCETKAKIPRAIAEYRCSICLMINDLKISTPKATICITPDGGDSILSKSYITALGFNFRMLSDGTFRFNPVIGTDTSSWCTMYQDISQRSTGATTTGCSLHGLLSSVQLPRSAADGLEAFTITSSRAGNLFFHPKWLSVSHTVWRLRAASVACLSECTCIICTPCRRATTKRAQHLCGSGRSRSGASVEPTLNQTTSTYTTTRFGGLGLPHIAI